ncbi:lantibiotic dehydratase [Streptomyces sp. B1866]|uniref:lantibiotic dehydratase n=1 Tax=Streptomyces sp. B1866 TaxID=3075431 RepID=UPI002892120F|nr:lantibiotic dehydratase [Streptomyces sp. B1866]MDT3395298.1 lantibiotic dehydratase [Streptomyces sp. B1866]
MVRSLFSHQPVAMARIPLRPAVSGPADHSAGLLVEGVFLASRSASQAAYTASSDPRSAATWRAYDLRSRTRATPHGVFSGVAPATFTGQAPALRLGSRHRAVTTPSPAWLTAVAEQLLDSGEVLPSLILTANNLVQQRGVRLEAEHPEPGGSTAQVSSIRATDVSRWLLDACQGGARAAQVLADLAARYPAAGAAAAAAVRQMIRAGFLLTDLLPHHVRDDPLGHLLARLPADAALRPALERLRDLLARADEIPPGLPERRDLLHAAQQTADEVVRVERPLTADTLADATLALPRAVGEQAAQAASVLWQVSQLTGPTTGYHDTFVRAYGRHRMVPLLEVIDPVTGIGPPADADDIGAQDDIGPRRAARLARLLAEATVRGQAEIAVDDALVQQLAHGGALPPPTAEIHVRLLRHGDELRVAVCPDGGSQEAGAACGRFARWLPELAPQTAEAAGQDGPLVAEIVCRPRTGPTAALAVETGFAPYRIPLGVPPREGDLTPDDLLVTSAHGHLTVWSARHQRPVRPVLFSRLAPDLLPPAARALRLIGHAGTRPWHTWSWGPAGYAPYTPRVRYQNIILAPARWRLPDELTDAAADRRPWDKALAAWRTDAVPTPPKVAVVEEADRRIPLDLQRDDDRELLRRSVRRGARTVTEPLGDGPGTHDAILPGPSGEHVVELVVNLTRRTAPDPPRPDPRTAVCHHREQRHHRPGGAWLSAALPVPAAHQDAVLRQLPDVLAPAAEHIDRWFWLRYHTPALGEHLRIRAHGDPSALAARALPLLSDWSAALYDQRLAGGLTLEPYEPETARYGGPKAISAAEEVFAADSLFTARFLALTAARDDRLLAAAVAAADIACTVSPRPREALRGRPLAAPDRRARDALRPRLRSAAHEPTTLIPEPLTTSWAARHTALCAYQAALPDPHTAILCASDMIHMHSNRLLGTDPAQESIARSLATDLLHLQAQAHAAHQR